MIQMLVIGTCICLAAVMSFISGLTVYAAQASSTLPVVTHNDILFKRNGGVNTKLATQFMQLADKANKATINPSSANEYQAAQSSNIRAANNSVTVPTIRLFQAINASPIRADWNTMDMFSNQRWRLAYISYPKEGDEDDDIVFTFWMASAYRNSPITSNATPNNISFNYNTAHNNEVNYRGTLGNTLRNNVTNDFNSFLNNHYPVARPHIVLPRDLPGSWQSNQPNIGTTAVGNSLTDERLNDYIWIPSVHEAGNHAAHLWGLTASERGFITNGFGASIASGGAWYRSENSAGNTRGNYHNSTGSAVDVFTGNPSMVGVAVRPAIHISFQSIIDEYPNGGEVEEDDPNRGTSPLIISIAIACATLLAGSVFALLVYRFTPRKCVNCDSKLVKASKEKDQ